MTGLSQSRIIGVSIYISLSNLFTQKDMPLHNPSTHEQILNTPDFLTSLARLAYQIMEISDPSQKIDYAIEAGMSPAIANAISRSTDDLNKLPGARWI